MDDAIKSRSTHQLIEGHKSEKFKETAYQKPKLTLDQLLEKARAYEAAPQNLDVVKVASEKESVNRVRTRIVGSGVTMAGVIQASCLTNLADLKN